MMRLEIKVDPAKSLVAGYEPLDYLDLDLTALTVEQRTQIAAIMSGTRIIYQLDAPTVEALLDRAAHTAEARRRDSEYRANYQAETAALNAANAEAVRQLLRERPVKEVRVPGSYKGRDYEYMYVGRRTDGISFYGLPEDLDKALQAWDAECRERTWANEQAARAEVQSAMAAEIAERAAMPLHELVARLSGKVPFKDEVTGLVGDDGLTVVLATASPCKGLSAAYKVNVNTLEREHVLRDGDGNEYEIAAYAVDDGVIEIEGAGWVATVKDPAAVKPVYDFCQRVPGGFAAPSVEVGDIVVWGAKDRKGRKSGPYDRLVYRVADDRIHVLKTNYVTARRLRKAMCA